MALRSTLRRRWSALSAATALIAAIAAPAAAQTQSCTGGFCGLAVEPVLIFEQTGALFQGTFHFNLIVYSNGLAVASRAVAPNFGPPPDTATGSDGRSEFTRVPAEAVVELRDALVAAGVGRLAGDLIDLQVFTTHTLIATVTFVRPRRKEGRGRANSFSFVAGDPQFADIATIVLDFKRRWFADF